MDNSKHQNTSVYIITSRYIENDRVSKLLKLKQNFGSLKIVQPGSSESDENKIFIKQIPNPTKILKYIKLDKLYRYINKYIYFPSENIYFVWSAKKTLKLYIGKDVKKYKKVVLIICLPPHDLSILGIFIKQIFPQIRLIVDWQDLWSYDENYFNKVPYIYRNRIYKLEKEIMQNSDMNITTNYNAKDVLEKKYNIPSEKVYAIEHHYDLEDFPNLHKIPKEINAKLNNDIIRIAFLGALFKPPRVPGYELLKIIKSLNEKGFNVELHIHGSASNHIKNQIEKQGLNKFIYFHGLDSHIESIKKLSNYDYLLLLLSDMLNSRAVMSIKLPHYLMIGVPILAIVPQKSAVEDIIIKTGSGYVIDSSGKWDSQLIKIFEEVHKNNINLKRNLQNIEYYSWQNISIKWLNAIAEC